MRLQLLAAALAAFMLWRHGRAARAALARGPGVPGARGAAALHVGTAAVALLLLAASLRLACR
jgi:hypothetical protein